MNNNLITLSFVKKNIYDVGEKIDFVLTDTFNKDKFKGTIIGVCDYPYAQGIQNVSEKWLKQYGIIDIVEGDLIKEPFYMITIHHEFNSYKKNDLVVIPQLFIDEIETKDAEDESFAVYVEMNLQSLHEEYNTKEDVISAITDWLDKKGLNPSIRLLKEYDNRDLISIIDSLKYYIKIDKTDKEVEKSVINLLRGATEREIIENELHTRRYEVYFSKVEPRKVICTPLIKFNRKDITFRY